MDATRIETLAQRVDEAARTGQTLTMLTQAHPDLDLETAYTVQRRSMARRLTRGERITGMKMGLTSTAKMEQMGVHDPIYGHLTNTMVLDPDATLHLEGLVHPRVEPEIAFTLGKDLSGTPSEAEAGAALLLSRAATSGPGRHRRAQAAQLPLVPRAQEGAVQAGRLLQGRPPPPRRGARDAARGAHRRLGPLEGVGTRRDASRTGRRATHAPQLSHIPLLLPRQVPMLHSAVAILKLAEMEYSGASALFMRVLLLKKYALPYRVVDALVDYFTAFGVAPRGEEAPEMMPLLWHQCLLAFAQHYKAELTNEQKERFKMLLRVQEHGLVTPDIRRELFSGRSRGDPYLPPLAGGSADMVLG